MLRKVLLGIAVGIFLAQEDGVAQGATDVEGISPSNKVSIGADRMLVVNGKRTFILGLYENPQDDAKLQEVAGAGFNLVRCSDKPEALDRLLEHGLFAWVNTGGRIDLSTDDAKRLDQLREMVATCASHPALLVWEVPDEALWNCWYGPFCWRAGDEPDALRERIASFDDPDLAKQLESQLDESRRLFDRGDYADSEALANDLWRKLGLEPKTGPRHDLSRSAETAAVLCAGMRKGYEALKKLDPVHPVWMNHAPRNQRKQLAAFNEAADIVGCDIYPVPEYRIEHSELADRSLSATGAYTTIMQEAAPGKPVWMVLQGFGWADIGVGEIQDGKEVRRRPTFEESRFMAYDAIVHGARGILYWGTAHIEKDSELWNDLMKLARELTHLQPVLSAPDAGLDLGVTYGEGTGSVDRGVRVLAKDVDGAVWLVVVNEEPEPVQYTLHGLESVEGMTYGDPTAGREVVVLDGALHVPIRGHGVQVLAPKPSDEALGQRSAWEEIRIRAVEGDSEHTLAVRVPKRD